MEYVLWWFKHFIEPLNTTCICGHFNLRIKITILRLYRVMKTIKYEFSLIVYIKF